MATMPVSAKTRPSMRSHVKPQTRPYDNAFSLSLRSRDGSPIGSKRSLMAGASGEVDLELISGPPYRTILRLALPTVVAMLSQSVVNEIDVFFFARLPHPEDSNAQ